MTPLLAAAPVGILAEPTRGTTLLVLLLAFPMLLAMVVFLARGRLATWSVLIAALATLGTAMALVVQLLSTQEPILSVLGGWTPPLGVVLRADGIGGAMILTTAFIACAIAGFAESSFRSTATSDRRAQTFWLLLAGVWGALNLVFLSNDLFTLFVAMELLTFSAIPLVCLDGGAAPLRAALRYLLFAMIGSMLYLLGAAIVYGSFGTLDLGVLADQLRAVPFAQEELMSATSLLPSLPPSAGPDAAGGTVGAAHASGGDHLLLALALMTVGMLAKTALFPLHFWLPPAHGGAPPISSALLSALVVKGSWFVVLRLWIDLAANWTSGAAEVGAASQFLAALGAAAILYGSVLALRQQRLKLLVAYSTVAQIGYLFLVFPVLVAAAPGSPLASAAMAGGMLQAISHAFAKAAMFLAAGLIAESFGHDRISRLGGAVSVLPVPVIAFLIGGLSLMGIPPSGGFWAKWLILSATITSGQWWWALVVLAGGLLSGAYLYRVMVATGGAAVEVIDPVDGPAPAPRPVPAAMQAIVLGLALISFLLGLVAVLPVDLFDIGRVVGWLSAGKVAP